jgi:hypothetical protein
MKVEVENMEGDSGGFGWSPNAVVRRRFKEDKVTERMVVLGGTRFLVAVRRDREKTWKGMVMGECWPTGRSRRKVARVIGGGEKGSCEGAGQNGTGMEMWMSAGKLEKEIGFSNLQFWSL